MFEWDGTIMSEETKPEAKKDPERKKNLYALLNSIAEFISHSQTFTEKTKNQKKERRESNTS